MASSKKFTIEKGILVDALNTCSLAVSKRDEDHINSHFIFKLNNGKLTLQSTDNYSISSVTTDKISGLVEKEPFTFTLKGAKILGLLGTLKNADTLSFDFDSEGMHVLINDKYDLPSLDFTSFPSFEEELVKAQNLGSIDIESFGESLRYISGYISTEPQARPELTLAPLLKKKIIATNGKTLGVYQSDKLDVEGFTITFNVINNIQRFIRRAGGVIQEQLIDDQSSKVDLNTVVAEAKEELKTKKVDTSTNKVLLLSSNNYFLLASGDKTLYYGYRKSEYKFPNKLITQQHLDEKCDNIFKIPRGTLLEVLNRLSFCLDETSSKMSCKFSGTEDCELAISVMGSHKRETKESFKVMRTTGDKDVSFDVNYKHLLRVLPLYLSPEIMLYVKDNAITFKDDAEDHTRFGVVTLLRKTE